MMNYDAIPTAYQQEKNDALRSLETMAAAIEESILRNTATVTRIKAVSIQFSTDGSVRVSVTSTKSRFISTRREETMGE